MKNDVLTALSRKTENRSDSAVKGLTEMFGLTDEIKVVMLPIAQLREKCNHPFKVVEDEKLNALAKSIKENGLMEPIIVRPLDTSLYEILAGHRRTRASQLNGEREIKAIIIKADDELANRIMISTNFQQRESHLPSEIAKSYLIRYNDLKQTRKNQDENSNGWNLEKIDKMMEKEFCTSKSKVYMYLRLNYLNAEMLDAVDLKLVNLKAAIEISYLRDAEQTYIYNIVCVNKQYKLDVKKASYIKKESGRRQLDKNDIIALLADAEKIKKPDSISFSKKELKRYQDKFNSYDDMKKEILTFLENYESIIESGAKR